MVKGTIAMFSLALVTTAYTAYRWRSNYEKIKSDYQKLIQREEHTTYKLVSNGIELLSKGYCQKNPDKTANGIFELEVAYTLGQKKTEVNFKQIVNDFSTQDKLLLHYALAEFNKLTPHPLVTTMNIWLWDVLSMTDPFPNIDLTVPCADPTDEIYNRNTDLALSLFLYYGINAVTTTKNGNFMFYFAKEVPSIPLPSVVGRAKALYGLWRPTQKAARKVEIEYTELELTHSKSAIPDRASYVPNFHPGMLVRGNNSNINVLTSSGLLVTKNGNNYVTSARHGFSTDDEIKTLTGTVIGDVVERSSEILDRVLWTLKQGYAYSNDALDTGVIDGITKASMGGVAYVSGYSSGRVALRPFGATKVFDNGTSINYVKFEVDSDADDYVIPDGVRRSYCKRKQMFSNI